MPDFAEPLPTLLEGVKAATAGLNFDCTLLGVLKSTSKGLMTDLESPGADDDEGTVAFLSTLRVLVESVTVGQSEYEYHFPSGSHIQGKEAKESFIRSNDSLAS